jgi:Plasmid pRiA4b ORF-3-like protein
MKKKLPGSGPQAVFTLKVTLLGSEPPIWRRVRLPADATLDALHEVLQEIFDWDGNHLHVFIQNWRGRDRIYFSDPLNLDDCEDELDFPIAHLLKRTGGKCHYEYDLGDSWMHEIVLEKVSKEPVRPSTAVCMAGARAAPLEDCGGLFGFYHNLEVLKQPEHPEHADLMEWMSDYDPESFDLAAINRHLVKIKL